MSTAAGPWQAALRRFARRRGGVTAARLLAAITVLAIAGRMDVEERQQEKAYNRQHTRYNKVCDLPY